MLDPTTAKILADPKFQEMVSVRNSYSWICTVLMLVAYFGFILTLAFDKALFAQKIGDGVMTLTVTFKLGTKIDDAQVQVQNRVSQALSAKPDWITFSSSSTVTNFFANATPGDLKHCRIASIGPVTSASLRAAGVEPHVEAQPHTMDGLLAALLRAN